MMPNLALNPPPSPSPSAAFGSLGTIRLSEVLKGRAGGQLTELYVSFVGMTHVGVEALMQTLEEGACPKLAVVGFCEYDMFPSGARLEAVRPHLEVVPFPCW